MKKFFVLSSWSRIAAIGSMLIMAFAVIGCDDDDSWSPSDADNSRSSSVIAGSDPESSSAEKQGSSSSSSVILSGDSYEGSSDSRSSDSKGNSSSANKAESSSSSETLPPPCKTNIEDNCEYGELNDDRDGQIYKTVKLDEQWWMAENLNYADSLTTPSLKGKSWCYDNYADYCAKYGRLYTWAAAVDSIALYDGGNGVDCGFWKRCELPARVQGICPSGWHLPTFDEWTALYEKFGGRSMAGRYLKSQKEWYDYEYRGKDAYGFNALPAGFREDDGYGKVRFDHLRNGTGFWSVTQPDTTSPFKMGAYMFELSDTHYSVSVVSSSKIAGVSIRCVKD